MAAKYSDINRGPELQNLYNKLQDWRKLDPQQKRTLYRAVAKAAANRVKPEYAISWVRPFTAAKDNIFYETKIPAADQQQEGQQEATLIRTLLAGRFTQIAPAGANDTVIVVPKFKFAKVRITRRTTTGAGDANAVSRITGKPYTRFRSNSMSGSFGQSDAQNDYFQAVRTIKAIPAYATFRNTTGNSISFRPEGA